MLIYFKSWARKYDWEPIFVSHGYQNRIGLKFIDVDWIAIFDCRWHNKHAPQCELFRRVAALWYFLRREGKRNVNSKALEMFLRFDRDGKKSIRINLQAKTKMSKYYLLFMNTVANVEHAKNIKLIYLPFLRGIFLIIFSLFLSRSSSSSCFLFIFQHEIFIITFLCGGVCVCILLGLREFLSLLMYSLITTFRALCAHLFIPNGLIVWDINISYASRYLCASVFLSQCSVCITLVLFIYNSTTFMVNDLWKIGKNHLESSGIESPCTSDET